MKYEIHPYGMCYTNIQSEYMYINIPKNASTWTNKLFKLAFDFKIHNFIDENLNKIPIVVLRDPLDRWATGLAEYLIRLDAPKLDDESLYNLAYSIHADEHTELQTYFLPNLNNVEPIYFFLNKNYAENIKHFILNDMGKKTWWNTNLQELEKSKNIADEKNLRESLKNKFYELVKEPVLLQKIQDYYKLDYDLINTVKFYQWNK